MDQQLLTITFIVLFLCKFSKFAFKIFLIILSFFHIVEEISSTFNDARTKQTIGS